MLEFGNKEFRNLEEQVLKNQEDIAELQSGIKISYWLSSLNDVSPLVKEENYGKYIVVGTSASKTLYVITRIATGELMAVILGDWPKKGDKGDKGDKGNTGDQGPQGERGIQGIQGIQGPLGQAGDGWNSLNEIDSASYQPTVIGREVETSANLNLANGNSKVINFKYDLPISSSDYIDIVENDNHNALVVKLRQSKLDTAVTEGSGNLITSGAVFNSLSTKLDATKDAIYSAGGLTTPNTAPNEKEIVGLNNDGSQIRIKIGNNLSLAGAASPYTLNAIGGGGGSVDTGILVVEYGVTPFVDINTAIGEGKLPVIYKDNYVYIASKYDEALIIFETVDAAYGGSYMCKVTSSNVWTTESKIIGSKWYKHNMTLSFNVTGASQPIQNFRVVIRDNFSSAYNDISTLISYKRSQLGGTVYNNTIGFDETTTRNANGNGILYCIKAQGDDLYVVETDMHMDYTTETALKYYPYKVTEIEDVVTEI